MYYQKKFILSKNSKSLRRTGVPAKYTRDLFMKMLNVKYSEEGYREKYKLVFKDRDASRVGDFVPYFTGFKSLAESLPLNYLNEEG